MDPKKEMSEDEKLDKFLEEQLIKYKSAYEKNSFEINKYLLIGTGGGIATIIGLNINSKIPQEIMNISILYLALLGVITLYELYLSEILTKKYYEGLQKLRKKIDTYENKKNAYNKLLHELPERKTYKKLEKVKSLLIEVLVWLVVIVFLVYLFYCINLIFS